MNNREKLCPVCQCSMIRGYIQARDSLYWNTKKRVVSALPPLQGDSIKLPEESSSSPFTSGYIPAYHCPKCKTLTVFYDDSENLSE